MGVMQNVTENIDVGKLLDNWDETHELTKDEALAILNCDDVCLDKLIETAYALRLKYKGKKVSIQLLTNVRSGNCSQNCAYCAQSCESQAQIEKYKRVSDEKLYGDNDLVDNKHLARHCIGLSGISFTDAEIEDLAGRIRKMKKNDTQICCSIGFLTEKQAYVNRKYEIFPGVKKHPPSRRERQVPKHHFFVFFGAGGGGSSHLEAGTFRRARRSFTKVRNRA